MRAADGKLPNFGFNGTRPAEPKEWPCVHAILLATFFYCDTLSSRCLFREFARYPSRRKRNVGSAKQMPTRKIARKCQWKPGIFSRRASDDIQIVDAAAVINKSHVNPEITQVAKGAAKNSRHAASPRCEQCKPKHRTGKSNPQIDKNAKAIFILITRSKQPNTLGLKS